MTTYNAAAVSDTVIAYKKGITLQAMRALRDNPIAISEGAAGAPRISGALRAIIDDDEIGAFVFASCTSATAYGATVAGSSLTQSGALSSSTFYAGTMGAVVTAGTHVSGSGTTLSGTWMCLGTISTSATVSVSGDPTGKTATVLAATLWQKVA